jgi:glycosyltransferase 2 family protein
VSRIFGSRAVRLAVAAGLTGYLLWISHPGDIARVAAGASLPWIGWACALVVVDRTLMACRWLLLLRPVTAAAPPPMGAVLRVFFVSTFVGSFLPASVGGDAVRAYSVRRHAVPGASAVASVVMDRVLGAVSTILLGVTSLVLSRTPVPAGVVAILAAGAVASAVLALVIFDDRAAALAGRGVSTLPGAPVRRFVQALVDAVRAYRHHHGTLATVTLASVGVQVLRVLQAWCLGRGLGLDVGLATYFLAIPAILLIMLLPITVNGLGTSQAAFLWLFGAAGVSLPRAFALSILFVALGVVGNLPGGLLYAFGGGPAPQPARSTSDVALK